MTKDDIVHYHGRFLGMKEHRGWEYACRTNARGVIVLVPVTDAGELVLVEQYRVPVRARVIELPAGLVGDNGNDEEAFEVAAHRELLEETGYRADRLEHLLRCPSTPGMANEMIDIYYASGLERVGPGGGDDDEDITVRLVPLDDATATLRERERAGVMVDPKIFAGLYWAMNRS